MRRLLLEPDTWNVHYVSVEVQTSLCYCCGVSGKQRWSGSTLIEQHGEHSQRLDVGECLLTAPDTSKIIILTNKRIQIVPQSGAVVETEPPVNTCEFLKDYTKETLYFGAQWAIVQQAAAG